MQEEFQTPHDSRASEMEFVDHEEFMEDWLDGHEYRHVQRGEIVRGRIVHIDNDGLMVDVGAKTEGIVATHDLQRLDDETVAALKEGDSVLVYCINPEDRDGNIILSISQARMAQDWERANQMYDDGTLIQSKVAGHNKGGLIVYLGKARGFVPASQLVRRRRSRYQESDSAQPWSELVGQELWLKVIECDADQNRLILSEQAAVRQRRKAMREELLAELREGDVVTGEVTSLADFGAFVDLGGADGLIHISEISWDRVEHPREILEIGEEVQVQVISIDQERKRIGLSIKRLEPEPWEVIDEYCQVGDLVNGTITKLTDFGAFARIDGGIEGLIHISELTDRIISHPNEVVQSGDQVTLRVIRIEPERRRIGLSLRQAAEGEWFSEGEAGTSENDDEEQPDAAEVSAVVARIGSQIELEEAVLESMTESETER